MGKIVIAVDDDISPKNSDALLWAMSYRTNPDGDMDILPHRGMGHGPKREHNNDEDGTLLIDATMKTPMPPLALPGKTYMEHARKIWERLQLPPLNPEEPWHGYSLGDWHDRWEADAERAAKGGYLKNGAASLNRQQPNLVPETSVRDVEDGWD